MLRRRSLALLLCIVTAALLSACSGNANPGPRAADGFSLRTLPESFALGGSANVSVATRELPDGGVAADISTDDAQGLKALYFELDYDASRYAPVSAEATGALAGNALQLAVLDDTGTVHCGQVLVRPQEQAGFSGKAVLAEVRFALRPGGTGNLPAAARHAVSAAPVTDASRATLAYDAGALTWGYCSNGDYDQNSETNIADLTPVGVHFNESTGGAGPFGPATIQSVVDGDSNGEINIADITPIGVNFGRLVQAYNVYAGADGGEYPLNNSEASALSPLSSIDYINHSGTPSIARLTFSFSLTLDPAAYYWVRPTDGALEGTASTRLDPVPVVNNPPTVDSIGANPGTVISAGTSAVHVAASDLDGDALTYSYSADIGSVTGSGPDVTFNAPTVAATQTATVSVTIDDGNGGSDSDSVQVQVDPPVAGNTPPTIDSLLSDAPTVASGDTVGVTAVASDADGDTLSYGWSATAGSIVGSGAVVSLQAPNVIVDTLVTVSLTVDDGRGGTDSSSVDINVIAPVSPPDAVHISFLPGANSGSGAPPDDVYELAPNFNYTFTATDQNGTDITSEVTWHYAADPGNPDLHQGSWAGNIFQTATFGFTARFHLWAVYHEGLGDELSSDWDLAGEEMHFTVVNDPPPS